MIILSDKESEWKYDKIKIASETALWSDLHGHEFVEIVYFCDGGGYHRIQDKYYPVKKGSLFLIPPGVIHCYVSDIVNPDVKGISVINLVFLKEILGENCSSETFTENIYNFFEMPAPQASDGEKEFIYCMDNDFVLHDLLREVREEQKEKRLGYRAMMESKLKEIMVLILRRHIEEGQKNLSVTSRGVILHIASILQQNYQNPPDIEELAKQFNISVSSIRRLFKETMGVSIGKYLQTVRIRWACQLLSDGLSVEEVMGRIGLQDRKHFYELFKRETGMTPKEYKMKKQSEI